MTRLDQMKQVLPIEGDFGEIVQRPSELIAVVTAAVHVWSVFKTAHLFICRGFVYSVM